MKTPLSMRARSALVTVVVFALLGGGARAQEVTAPTLKAALLYNFTKFADWPAENPARQKQLRMCVVGDGNVAAALEQIIRANRDEVRELVVAAMKPDAALTSCDVLFVGSSERRRTDAMLSVVRDQPVLTVGDAPGFADAGGIAEFIVDRSQIRFAINTTAAKRSRIHLSSKLLRLASVIKDGADDLQ